MLIHSTHLTPSSSLMALSFFFFFFQHPKRNMKEWHIYIYIDAIYTGQTKSYKEPKQLGSSRAQTFTLITIGRRTSNRTSVHLSITRHPDHQLFHYHRNSKSWESAALEEKSCDALGEMIYLDLFFPLAVCCIHTSANGTLRESLKPPPGSRYL
jgi:hypothetical protein